MTPEASDVYRIENDDAYDPSQGRTGVCDELFLQTCNPPGIESTGAELYRVIPVKPHLASRIAVVYELIEPAPR